jgi:AbrB family looped-hinge helix DNA binding protein
MEVADVTLAARGQIVIPKEARDALGLKPGARLSVRVEGSRLLLEKRVALDLGCWIGKAVDDGLSTEQALAELRGRTVPWQAQEEPASRSAPRKEPAAKRTAGKRKATRA